MVTIGDAQRPPPTDILSQDINERTPLLAATETPLSPLLSDRWHPHRHNTQKHFHMYLEPSVYCTILYAPLVCRIKTGHEWGKSTKLAIALVTLNMVLQVGMLRIMDVYGQRDAEASVGGIMEYEERDHVAELGKESYVAFLSPHEREVLKQADAIKPLCTIFANGTYSCRPPSVAFTSRWESLDTDGDGIWTMHEAAATEEMLNNKSKHHERSSDNSHEANAWISKRPTLIFNSIVNGIKQRSRFLENLADGKGTSLYLSEALKNRTAIPKAYFDYWTGDAMMCTRFDRSTCEHVVASGLFDMALTEAPIAATSKGIYDYDSAVRYCQVMLEAGGGCEESLPLSFTENLQSRRSMCGVLHFIGAGSMTNPADKSESLAVMEPGFSLLDRERRAVDSMFIFFKILLMFIFYSSVLQELRDLVIKFEFLVRFPGLESPSDPGGLILEADKRGPEGKQYRVTGISRKHRGLTGIIFLLQVAILFLLLRFGSAFLLKESHYIELVMNALALTFITGIDEMIYLFMETSEIKADGFEDVEPLKFETIVPKSNTWIGYCFTKECWGLFVLPLIAIVVVLWNVHGVRMARIEAMTCACLSEGEHCAESMVNQGEWWQHYWSHILPAAMHQIEGMRLDGS